MFDARSGLAALSEGAGQLRDGGDGGEAGRRRPGDVAGGRFLPRCTGRNETIRLPSFNRNDFIASQGPSKSCWRLALPASAATFK